MPDNYARCIAALRKQYSTMEVVRFESPVGIDPRLRAERLRLEILRDTVGDVLYMDPDNMPGIEKWIGSTQCCAINGRGGQRDTSVIYKPEGQERVIQTVIDSGKSGDVLYFPWVQSFGSIAGYPDNRYFLHLHLGGPVVRH